MPKFLYGASVQGIQQFIFRTNELQSVIHGSDVVKSICTDLFKSLLDECQLELDKEHAVINAAGHVKYIFDDKEKCEYVVRHFPRKVLEYAPGITLSQAVKCLDEEDFRECNNLLEEELACQRNKPIDSLTIGLMGIERDRKTNQPCISIIPECENPNKDKDCSLCNDAFGKDEQGNVYQSIYDIERMANENDWIAVIHADGNNIGKVVQQKSEISREKFLDFSERLDADTKQASRNAFNRIKADYEANCEVWKRVPIRPVVLGGDDFSVICRADLALQYVAYFMEEFESLSKTNVEGGLTACAGIAFVKSSFPFYYAYELAESLCDAAKREAKQKAGDGPAPSCLMFHKVQDSFITDYKDIEQRELTPNDSTSFKYGPYYLHEQKGRWTIENLLKNAEKFQGKDGNAVKSRLRNWMTLLHDNPQMAEQELNRIKSIYADETISHLLEKVTEKDCEGRLPVYDLLTVHTIKNQITKSQKK